MRSVPDVTGDGARAIVEHVIAAAGAAGRAVSVAVVDRAGVLVALQRMTPAPGFSAELAIAKARTAAAFGRSTVEMESVCEGRSAFTTGFLAQGAWYVGRGGHPLRFGGEIVGGVGVSGDAAEHEDHWAADAALVLDQLDQSQGHRGAQP